jgi:exosortase/archaeosortase family protein
MSAPATVRLGGRGSATAPRLILWVILSLAPVAGYALPLWQSALADTPLAYLVWVPVLAMAWGTWSLLHLGDYVDDGELDALLGLGLAAAAGFVMVLGLVRWPYTFVGESAGLLLWPLWSLGIAWLLFGLGASRVLLAPLGYLVLAWPPILSLVAAVSQGLLVDFAVRVLNALTPIVNWVGTTSAVGVYLVHTGASWYPVQVSMACSGADSVIAVLIVLPILLTQFLGSLWRKFALILAAVVLAVALNLLRLVMIISAIHLTGPAFGLGVLHPMLGFILFGVLVVAMNALARGIGLQPRALPDAATRLAPTSPFRVATALAVSGVLFALLLPLFTFGPGSPGKPIAARTASLSALMPSLPGFSRRLVGRFNDGSILGPGATSLAYAYTAKSGAYVMAELWATTDLGALTSYTYQNCLLFHGETIAVQRSFLLSADKAATEYGVLLPAPTVGGGRSEYADVEWTTAIAYHGTTYYIRAAVSAPPEMTSVWPAFVRGADRLQPPTGVLAMAAAPDQGRWPADFDGGARALAEFAMRFDAAMQRAAQAPTGSTLVASATAAAGRRA